jgi:hypothetical protein
LKLESLLKIPSIRTMLDNWLVESEFGGKSKFKNNVALEKFEKLIIQLHDEHGISIEKGFKIATAFAEALIEELYN